MLLKTPAAALAGASCCSGCGWRVVVPWLLLLLGCLLLLLLLGGLVGSGCRCWLLCAALRVVVLRHVQLFDTRLLCLLLPQCWWWWLRQHRVLLMVLRLRAAERVWLSSEFGVGVFGWTLSRSVRWCREVCASCVGAVGC